MKFIFALIFLLIHFLPFSQSGTYKMVSTPKEAKAERKNTNGTNEFPVLIGSFKIKLTKTKKVIFFSSDDFGNEIIRKGKWSKNAGIITLEIDNDSINEIYQFKIVEYKSGIYLKSTVDIQYYKKQ